VIPMHFSSAWLPSLSQISNHLLQSTIFAGVAALLALALRANHARARCWLWLAASVKFLIPFSALIAIGKDFAWRGGYQTPRLIFTMIWDQVAAPVVRRDAVLRLPAPAMEPSSAAPAILLAIWFCGLAAVAIRWWLGWLRIRAKLQGETFDSYQCPQKRAARRAAL